MLNFVPRWMLPVLAASLLTACAGGSSNQITDCPPIKEYSREFQNKLADELEAAPEDAVWPLVVQDYSKMRSLLFVCKNYP